jgi:hypothetical protein
MNKQINELKIEDMQDVVGGLTTVSVNPNVYLPGTIVAQPAYKLPTSNQAPPPAPTWGTH